MEDAPIYGTAVSVVPPLVAIILAIATRQVFLSLFLGIWAGWSLLAGDPLNGLAMGLDACVGVFSDAGNTRVIIFSAMIGALITLTRYTGGVSGFVEVIRQRGLVRTQRRALLLSWLIGVVVFIESSITSLVNGSVCRPLFDKLKISREKLAYLCDATAAPICILIPLNAWGATITQIMSEQGVEAPIDLMASSIPLNFYAIGTLLFSLVVVVWMRRDFGPMRKAEERVRTTGKLLRDGAEPMIAPEVTGIEPPPGSTPRAINFLIPIAVMVIMMPLGLLITGEGDMLSKKASGSTAVLWAVMLATATAAIMGLTQRRVTVRKATDLFFKGFGGLMPLAVLMVLAFAIGDTTKAMGTNVYLAGLAKDYVDPSLIPLILFALSCLVAFSTGTSWGTFAIMLPIAIKAAADTGMAPELAVAAVLSGGIFGDHCSPISDTTVIASMAAGTDHIDHVNTQLPYALTVAGVSAVGFVIAGLAM